MCLQSVAGAEVVLPPTTTEPYQRAEVPCGAGGGDKALEGGDNEWHD